VPEAGSLSQPEPGNGPVSVGARGKWIKVSPPGADQPSPLEGEGGEAQASPGEGAGDLRKPRRWRLSTGTISSKSRSPKRTATARRLRSEMTDAEQALWRLLRSRRLVSYKFRRQIPIGPYVADFACLSAKLIVEADGGQHGENAEDLARTAWLKQRGYQTIRFWNNDILQNPDGVLALLLEAVSVQGVALPEAIYPREIV
jgi:very-short-patch-repair endonuclease